MASAGRKERFPRLNRVRDSPILPVESLMRRLVLITVAVAIIYFLLSAVAVS